jgi:hypothetical protein
MSFQIALQQVLRKGCVVGLSMRMLLYAAMQYLEGDGLGNMLVVPELHKGLESCAAFASRYSAD